jgi:hypothetical protein
VFLGNCNYILAQQTGACKLLQAVGNFKEKGSFRLSFILSNSSTSIIRCAGHIAQMGEKRNAYRILVGQPEGRRALGRTRRSWADNIKMDLREI